MTTINRTNNPSAKNGIEVFRNTNPNYPGVMLKLIPFLQKPTTPAVLLNDSELDDLITVLTFYREGLDK